jgi:hypothetical protein
MALPAVRADGHESGGEEEERRGLRDGLGLSVEEVIHHDEVDRRTLVGSESRGARCDQDPEDQVLTRVQDD